MKSFKPPVLRRDRAVTFQGIPEEEAEKSIAEMTRTIQREMRRNEISEMQSIRFASSFVTTPSPNERETRGQGQEE